MSVLNDYLLDELGDDNDDDHFKEFTAVVKFLYDDDNKFTDYQNVWSNYSVSLKELKNNEVSILNLQQNVGLAEEKLYGCMCRTERISVMDSTDYIDDSSKHKYLEINENDINSYRGIIELINKTEVKAKFTVDFIKSSPYILSFMHKYDLKQKLEKYFKSHPENLSLAQSKLLWLNYKAVNNYEELPLTNARLTRLLDEVFKSQSYAINNTALFLWVPPSMPYYEFGGVYRGSEGFSKTLIFSAWEMVPRMQMFDAAHNEKQEGDSDLIPYWCFGKDQEIKIERLPACYPFSRDESTYERLSKILSLYRLTLGQPRQEELLEYVFREFGNNDRDILKNLFINLSPYSK